MLIIPISDDNIDRAITPCINYPIILMGAHLLLYSVRRVTEFLLRFFTQVPAWVAVGLWFVFQLIGELGLLGNPSAGGGVAYAAHIGGLAITYDKEVVRTQP